MTRWFRTIGISIISILSFWLMMPTGVALSIEQPPAGRPSPAPILELTISELSDPELTIVPRLTNSAEVPVAETQPEAELSLNWLGQASIFEPPIEINDEPTDAPMDIEPMEATLEKWLLSVKAFFENN